MSSIEEGPGAEAELVVLIRMAWAAVEQSEIPDRVQELAFKEVLRAKLGTVPRRTETAAKREAPSTPDVNPGNGVAGDEHSASAIEVDVLRDVSKETGVPIAKLEQVFYVDDGTVKLIGQHTRFGSNTTDQARTIAQVVTIVRKLGLGHNDTLFEVIKDACESKHCYDSKNFASSHMPGIGGFVIRGEKKSRRLEAKGNGVTAFSDLIDKILLTP